jgi:hypothetical protein
MTDNNLADGTRQRRPPDRYGWNTINKLYAKSLRMEEGEGDAAFGYAFSILYDAEGVPYPRSQSEASKRSDADKWAEADRLELESMREQEVFEVINIKDVPPGERIYHMHPIYTKKYVDGKVTRYKARWVVDGSRQGISADDKYAPTAKAASMRFLLALSAHLQTVIHQGDVPVAYLHSHRKTPGYVYACNGQIWKVYKSIYGWQDSGQNWGNTSDNKLIEWGYKPLAADPCVLVKHQHIDNAQHVSVVLRHVDDYLWAATHPQLNDQFLQQMTHAWKLKYLGVARFALGCHFEFRGEDGNLITTDNYKQQRVQSVKIHQQQFVEDCVRRFGLQDSNTHGTPMEMNLYLGNNDISDTEKKTMQRTPYGELVGSLNWLAVMTRPDISDAVGQLARHLQNPSNKHWEAAKHVLRYLKGYADLGPVYKAGTDFKPNVYSDASFQRCPDTLRSTSGMVVILAGGPISWRSKRQSIIADSTCEAEYMALNEAVKEGSG